VKANPKIKFTWDTVVEAIKGNGTVNAVTLKNVKTGERREHPTQGVFIFIGHDPNSSIFKEQLAMDDDGYVLIDSLMRTNVEGVFAGGEIADRVWKQAATSVGQGCAAALSAVHWLQENEAKLQPLDEAVMG
jgi:thioredoxin reductase (NADPH)